MAQSKSGGPRNNRNASTKKKKSNNKKRPPLFSAHNKPLLAIIFIFVALLMAAIVIIDAESLWGMLRNFLFGVFGINAFIAPVFMIFTCIVALIERDTRNYKIIVTECFVLFTLFISLLHIFTTDASLTYGEQIKSAYEIFKNYSGQGMHFGFGVFGALFGSIPLLLTGSNKLAAGIFVALIFLALLLIFFGSSIIRLIMSLRKPAEAVSEYAGDKADEIKETCEEVATEIDEKKKRKEKSKQAERRRKESKHEVELDIPLDDDVEVEDVGVDPILNSDEDEEEAPGLEDVLAIIEEKTGPIERQNYEEVVETEEEAVETEEELVVDEETGEVIEEESQGETEVIEEEETTVEAPVEAPVAVYELPSVELLDEPKRSSKAGNGNELREKGETIVKTLQSFGVGTRIVEICQSPSVTRFELQPEPGVKISKITALADDIAMNLAASGVRIEAPIPNKNAVGIEVPNAEKAMVTLREILETDSFKNSKSKINVALGRDIQGESTCADLAKMPHLLVAGTTGSGKPVCLNTMIMSLLFNSKPDEVKLIMIDPKKVEFTVYKSIPHLLIPVVADPRKAAGALSWAVAEMDKRYALFADNGVRNLQGYNTYAVSHNLPKLPQIVIIIDELSDLMMAASNEVEDSICRLAQKARAAGMHLIVATQRPSVDVITGLIKANIPSRIAFAVKSQIDSRTIIDVQGAEKLLGNGDMLYCPVGLSKPVRVQGCYVSDDEIERVIEFVTSQGDVKYDDSVMQEIEIKSAQTGGKKKGGVADFDDESAPAGGFDDEMTPKAAEVVIEAGMASTTLLQRKLKLGYARAARIIDELSEKGIIGPFEGAKPRKVLITKDQWYEMLANSTSQAPKQLSVDDIAPANNTEMQEETPKALPSDHNYFGSAVNNDLEDE